MLLLFVPTVILLLHTGNAQINNCSTIYNRMPDNRDLVVDCGTNNITLEVNLCTAQWGGYNASDLVLNGEHNNSLCKGIIDPSRDPPIIRYMLPVNSSDGNPCRQTLQIVDEVPQEAIFSSFSSIQFVIISGYIDTPKSSYGIISYATDLYYQFSCRYPLEYFLKPNQIVTSSVSLATNNNNGSFANTLSMNVYNDTNYTIPLDIPPTGLPLRRPIFVEVKATNLSNSLNLLLDQCFATPSPLNGSTTHVHTFFIGCHVDPRTVVYQNGVAKAARFYFEAFRFVEHRNRDRSSIFLNCIVRLCEPSKCLEIMNACKTSRKRRDIKAFGEPSVNSATVSLGPIYTAEDAVNPSDASESTYSATGCGHRPPRSDINVFFSLSIAVGIVMLMLN
ncbi:zona pellucida-like domain-containing protein 1 [Brienomyrus brachyistius]|uniref:zona pellucida-like domain-containing protein 1 n=1 Tax=Brienomyrus brachyistius TaxID=42636 RepID=UPI0020B29C15|nr:zona pellucida-like domain-containing protein 1 [Brienomyrus brachyistius]